MGGNIFFTIRGKAGMEVSKSQVFMNAWQPFEAVMFVGKVGYARLGWWVRDVPSKAGCVLIAITVKITTS